MVGPWRMRQSLSYQVFVVVFAVILLSILGTMLYQWFERPESEEISPEEQRVTVTSVIDGDTFTATGSGGEDLGRLRVLGIDAPEVARDSQAGECHAVEATDAATQLLDEATVTITHDPTQGQQDRYGRLLVYVDVVGIDFAQDMLSQGHARLYDDADRLERQDSYIEAVQSAQDRRAGLWATC